MILVSPDASPSERLDAIFVEICTFKANNVPIKYASDGIVVNLKEPFMFKHPTYFGLRAQEEMVYYLNQLYKQGLLVSTDLPSYANVHSVSGANIPFNGEAVISFKGQQYLHEVENKAPFSRKCFVAMAFDNKKQMRMDAINEACRKFDFTAFTIDEHNEAGNHTIDAKIILAIKGSRFCIVDFTGTNAGAYMEAGYAMGRDKKVIFICEESDFENNRKHFDVNHYPFLRYSDFSDLTTKLYNGIGAYVNIEK